MLFLITSLLCLINRPLLKNLSVECRVEKVDILDCWAIAVVQLHCAAVKVHSLQMKIVAVCHVVTKVSNFDLNIRRCGRGAVWKPEVDSPLLWSWWIKEPFTWAVGIQIRSTQRILCRAWLLPEWVFCPRWQRWTSIIATVHSASDHVSMSLNDDGHEIGTIILCMCWQVARHRCHVTWLWWLW